MQLIADGKAPRVPQTEEGASYEGIQKKSNAKVSSSPSSCSPESATFHHGGTSRLSLGNEHFLRRRVKPGPQNQAREDWIGLDMCSPAPELCRVSALQRPQITATEVWEKKVHRQEGEPQPPGD